MLLLLVEVLRKVSLAGMRLGVRHLSSTPRLLELRRRLNTIPIRHFEKKGGEVLCGIVIVAGSAGVVSYIVVGVASAVVVYALVIGCSSCAAFVHSPLRGARSGAANASPAGFKSAARGLIAFSWRLPIMDLATVLSLLSRTNPKSVLSILSTLVDGLSVFESELDRAKSGFSQSENTGTSLGVPIITSLCSAILHVVAAHEQLSQKVTSANVPPVQM